MMFLKNSTMPLNNKNKQILLFDYETSNYVIATFQEFAYLYFLDKSNDYSSFALEYQSVFNLTDDEYKNFESNVKFKYSTFLKSEGNKNILKDIDLNNFLIETPNNDQLTNRLENPSSYIIQLTTRCYTNCTYCYAERKEICDIDFSSVYKFLQEALQKNGKLFTFSGGDPTVYDFNNLIKLIRLIYSYKGTTIIMSTKNPNLSYEQFVELRNAGMDILQFSLDSDRPEVLENLLGISDGKKYLDRIVDSISNAVKAGLRIRVHVVVSNKNIDHLEEYINNFLAELPLHSIEIVNFKNSLFIDNGIFYDNSIEMKLQLIRDKMKCVKFKIEYAFQMQCDLSGDLFHYSRCGAGNSLMVISPKGKAIFCDTVGENDQIVLGDINSNSIDEIWENYRLDKIFDKAKSNKKCKSCDMLDRCFYIDNFRCLANVLRFSNDINDIDTNCCYYN